MVKIKKQVVIVGVKKKDEGQNQVVGMVNHKVYERVRDQYEEHDPRIWNSWLNVESMKNS